MPSASRTTTAAAIYEPDIEGRYAQLGGYTVGFATFKQAVDATPYFVGLPDDRCPCEHWGVVTAGELTFRWADHEETFVAGDAYYAPPGHLPLATAGASVTEFSPAEEWARTTAAIESNLRTGGSS
jgi:hypothetical protein